MVVISGPEATAGSILIFLKITGMTVPKKLDKSIAASSEMPMQPEVKKDACTADMPRFTAISDV